MSFSLASFCNIFFSFIFSSSSPPLSPPFMSLIINVKSFKSPQKITGTEVQSVSPLFLPSFTLLRTGHKPLKIRTSSLPQQTHRQMSRQTTGQTNRQADRQTGRHGKIKTKKDTHTHTEITDRQIYTDRRSKKYSQTYRHTQPDIHKQTVSQTYTERQIYTDRNTQTDKEIDRRHHLSPTCLAGQRL